MLRLLRGRGGEWQAGLSEPLIDASSSSSPSSSPSPSPSPSLRFSGGGTVEAETAAAAAARAKALVVVQERLLTGGVLLYCGGFLIDGGSHYWLDHADPYRDNPHDLSLIHI